MGTTFTRVLREARDEQRLTLVETITDAAPLEYGWRTKRQWLPNSLRVTFERDRHNDEPWSPWRVLSGRLYGHNVKQDGSLGAERFERFSGHADGLSDDVSARILALLREVEAASEVPVAIVKASDVEVIRSIPGDAAGW